MLLTIQIDKTIISSVKIFIELLVTNFKVVADHKTVAKIVIFLSFLLLADVQI